jgi:nicotinate-nucleotide--dimethylbenzimidazole phosphoribosyltransferase
MNLREYSLEDKEKLIWQKINTKTKPLGSLGKLESLAAQVCKVQNTLTPQITNPQMLVFAGDHGLAQEGVSAYPQEVTWQMVLNFLNGGAAINVFSQQENLELQVVDAGVNFNFDSIDTSISTGKLINQKIGYGTRNSLEDSAMDTNQVKEAIERGRRLIKELVKTRSTNCLGFGEMGIGNTSSASLIFSAISGKPIETLVGSGTGVFDAALDHKIEVLQKVSNRHDLPRLFTQKSTFSALDWVEEVLSKVGGFEIAMILGAILQAKEDSLLILIDGFIVGAVVLLAHHLDSSVLENCIFAHVGNEKAHRSMLEFLKADPLLDLGLRLGEGSGAALAFPLIQAAVNFMNNMASFESAEVSEASKP